MNMGTKHPKKSETTNRRHNYFNFSRRP